MSTPSDRPNLSAWFWELLESANRSLRSLCGKLEQLPREQLRHYRAQYDEAKEYVNPCYCPEPGHGVADISEDDADDFAAWVVMQGRAFYDRVRAEPAAVGQHLELFRQAERGEGDLRWDEGVDRPEYRGYQRADSIVYPIYRMRFGEDLDAEQG